MKHFEEISVAIVADDESLCRSLGRMLREIGMKPTPYPSVEAFLEDAQRPRFDCLLLDMQLDDVAEIELHRRSTSSNLLSFSSCLKRKKKT